MRLATTLFLLPIAVLGMAANDKDSAVAKRLGSPNHRQMDVFDLGGLCTSLFSQALGEAITCSCLPTIFPSLAITASCSTTDQICLGGGGEEEEENLFCASPVVSGSLDITALLAGAPDAITFDVCFTETTLLGFPLDDLGLPLCVSAAQAIFEADAAPESCVATLGGETCNSCKVCRRNRGMKFDCSNIDPEIVSSTCTGSFPQSFADVSKPDGISMPGLDGLRR